MSRTFLTWLRGLDEHRLAALLRLRPDACAAPAPASLEELTERLSTARSVEHVALTLNELELSLLEVLLVLDDPTRDALFAFVPTDSVTEAAEVELALARLVDRGLCVEAEGRLQLVGAVREVVPRPLGLGRPVAALLGLLGQQWISTVARTLGLKQGPGAKLTRTIAQHLTVKTVNRLVDEGGPAVRDLLLGTLANGSSAEVTGIPTVALLPSPWRPESELTWALDRGLLLPAGYTQVELPREVGLALRGADWQVRLLICPPDVPTVPADEESVEREAQAALTGTVRAVSDVLDLLGTAPATQLKSSGIGVRESAGSPRRSGETSAMCSSRSSWPTPPGCSARSTTPSRRRRGTTSGAPLRLPTARWRCCAPGGSTTVCSPVTSTLRASPTRP